MPRPVKELEQRYQGWLDLHLAWLLPLGRPDVPRSVLALANPRLGDADDLVLDLHVAARQDAQLPVTEVRVHANRDHGAPQVGHIGAGDSQQELPGPQELLPSLDAALGVANPVRRVVVATPDRVVVVLVGILADLHRG